MGSQITNDADTAGGDISASAGGAAVYVEGLLVAVNGDGVAPHVPLVPPHISASMIASSNNVYSGGIPIVRLGNSATCGHTSTGCSKTFVGG